MASDLGMECGIGSCFTNWNYGTGEEYKEFDSYASMREYFDKKLAELQVAGRVKSAWVNKDGETVFRWSFEDVEPVQEKFEIYLTDPEREALEVFWRKHKECKDRFPRGPGGWNFAYEVLPGVCGADDGDLRVTCLRCGESLASKDRKIVDEAFKVPIEKDDRASLVLNLLHERATRKVRFETISVPHRYYDVAGAIGYVQGLLDALRITGDEGQLDKLFQHVIAYLTDADDFGYSADLKNLIRSSSEKGHFDWVIAEAWPFVRRFLNEGFDADGIEWVNKSDADRG